MPAHAVFCERSRELPGLHRGWRTPDPSPSREAKEMTTYAVELCILDDRSEVEAAASPWPRQSVPEVPGFSEAGGALCTPVNCSTDEVSTTRGHSAQHGSEGKGAATESAPKVLYAPGSGSGASVSTPRSHAPRYEPVAESTDMQSESFYNYVRQRTPSPEVRYVQKCGLCPGGMPAQLGLPNAQLPPFQASAYGNIAAQDRIPLVAGIHLGYLPDETMGPEPKSCALKQAPLGQAEAQQGPAQWMVSRGSIGHPSSCGEPCKYAKKRRGCKEGAACDRCHVCKWNRHAVGHGPKRPGPPAMPR